MSFWRRFGVVLGSLLGSLGRPNRAKIGPRGPQVRPKRVRMTIFMRKSDFSRNTTPANTGALFCLRQPPTNRAKIAPRRLQDLPKTILKTLLLHRLFRLRFWSVLAPTWAPFPPPWAPKTAPKSTPKTSENHVAARWPPRSLQDGPRWLQDGPGLPKGRPKTPQTPPRTPPNAPQEAPRSLQER